MYLIVTFSYNIYYYSIIKADGMNKIEIKANALVI